MYYLMKRKASSNSGTLLMKNYNSFLNEIHSFVDLLVAVLNHLCFELLLSPCNQQKYEL